MNEIYKGTFLQISFEPENNLFVQKWISSPQKVKDFKEELLVYSFFYEKLKPKHTLWLQTYFTLTIDYDTALWLEEYINKPCFHYGNEKCAFVVSKDILTHISVMDSFDKIQSCIIPKHFSTEEKAREWLNSTDKITENPYDSNEKKMIYEGVDEEGNVILKLSSKDIKQTFKSIYKSVRQESFFTENRYKLDNLTKREMEIIKFVVEGKKHQEIADSLFISLLTVRTHWKNIKSKLNFETESQVKFFLNAMNR